MDLTIRPARLDDATAVEAFAADTWPEHGGDYVPRVFPRWVESDGPEARTLVAAVDDRAVGLVRTVLLSADEAWCGGLRVDPAYRGEGIARRLTEAGFSWARTRGASVARAMVFSWNAAGLGVARAAGFEPATEFRWAHPAPNAAVEPGEGSPRVDAEAEPGPAWSFWQRTETRDFLRGLALDPNEPWALSWLTRERVARAASEGRLLVVRDGGVRGTAIRVRVSERPANGGATGGTDDDATGDAEADVAEDTNDARDVEHGSNDVERWAEYGVAVWADATAAEAVLTAVARDAASVGADRTRVLIPETVRAMSDVAAASVGLADDPDFVLAADLTG